MVAHWTSYRDFWFESDQDAIQPLDANKLAEIAAYMKQNPSLQIGIDTFADTGNQDLRDRRVKAVRNALIQAGVPAQKIGTGSFGAAKPRRDARVEVLFATSPAYTTSQK